MLRTSPVLGPQPEPLVSCECSPEIKSREKSETARLFFDHKDPGICKHCYQHACGVIVKLQAHIVQRGSFLVRTSAASPAPPDIEGRRRVFVLGSDGRWDRVV